MLAFPDDARVDAEHQASVTVRPRPSTPDRARAADRRRRRRLLQPPAGPAAPPAPRRARARPRTSPRGSASSRTGVLQQLHALETAGLVSRQAVRHGVGRPRHVYDVTDAAQDLFPTNYDGLASGLLAAIRAIGGEELVDGVFDERRRMTRDRDPAADGRSAAGRRAARRSCPRAGRHPGRAGLPRRDASIGADGVIRLSSATARSTASPPTTAPPARPSSTCSARSSAPTSSARRTSRRAIAAAPTASAAPSRLTAAAQASSRSTTTRDAGSRRGAGTSETFGTNDAASDVAAACSWSSTDRMPSRPSGAISSRM